MIMSGSGSIGHCRKLIAIGSVPFLAWLLTSHERPLSVDLGGDIVEVPEMTALFSTQLRIFVESVVEFLRQRTCRVQLQGCGCSLYLSDRGCLAHCKCGGTVTSTSQRMTMEWRNILLALSNQLLK